MTEKELIRQASFCVIGALFFIGCFLGMCLLFWGSNYWHSEPNVPQRLGDLNLAIGMIGFFIASAVARYISR